MTVCSACGQENPAADYGGFADMERAIEIATEANSPEVVRSHCGKNRWQAAANALVAGDFTRLRAAEVGLPDAQLEKAIAFYRRAEATAYLARAEALVEATA